MRAAHRKHLTALGVFLLAGHAAGQIQHGLVEVIEHDGGNDQSSTDEMRAPGGFGAWTVTGGDRGDYAVDFGFPDDVQSGALITAPAQDGRIEPSVNDGDEPYFYTTHASPGAGGDPGKWFIPIANAPDGFEVNGDVNLAFFPYADDWLAGYAFNEQNGGVIADVIGDSDIQLCNAFTGCTGDGIELLDAGTGHFALHVEGADLRRDGVLLAIGAKNEDNFAQVALHPQSAFRFEGPTDPRFIDGWSHRSTAFIQVKDNGDNGAGQEQDPFSFVWIPENTPGVTMGNFTGQPTKLFSQGEWQIERTGQGTFRLTITDEGPDTGTLFLQPSWMGGFNNQTDNIVYAEPDGDGWIITTRDIPDMGPQDLPVDVVASFAFFPDDAEISGPGTPTASDPEAVDTTAAARFEITENNGSNDFGSLDGELARGDGRLDLAGLNRGDIALRFVNGLIGDEDGITIPVITEFVRDNSGTGGVSGDGNAAVDNGLARTFNADGVGGEMNIDFAAAYFPRTSGFPQAWDVGTGGVEGVDIDLSDIDPDAEENGILITTNWDNNNRTNNVTPVEGGFNVTAFEAQGDSIGQPATDSVESGYVYLPYETQGLIAGQIDDTGSVINGTGGFSVSQGTEDELGFDVWKLSIDGADANTDGVLILNPRGDEPAQFAWEADANGDFEVGFLRLTDQAEILPGFNFAFIPFDGLSAPEGDNCPPDLTGDGAVTSADFLAFIDAFASGDDAADFDGNGAINSSDFLAYIDAFAAGCP